MLYRVVPNAFYNDLRTKQQTGYLVQSNPEQFVPHHGMALFLVQSAQYLPGNLIKRFLEFISGMLVSLKSKNRGMLPEARFQMIKKSMLLVYNTPNQNIKTVSDLMFNLLDSYNGDWTTE